MAEARDRLERAVNYAATFAANKRRQGVVLDEAATRLGAFEHPVQRLLLDSRVPGSLNGENYTSWRPVRGNESGHRGPRGHSPTEPMSWPRPRRG
ncbi:hypothetical protein F2Q70_00026193 [Brassica cretica]|uniref:Uncharacterized protein n=1 Tax=Brassica cretica TaxID=69181 RepID=A0A8S9LJK6_BRACR|nr:hypothetical protein F2Q70_00026193 [Brassica cretica]